MVVRYTPTIRLIERKKRSYNGVISGTSPDRVNLLLEKKIDFNMIPG
jgi:hypothetical protein